MKNISIVTVTYNSSSKLEKFFKSISAHTHLIKDIIIIENGSRDSEKTQLICKKFANKLPISFILSKNVGFGRSCNLGAYKSSGEYILFLNPDTELLDNSLQVLMKHYIMTNADIIGGKSINYEGITHGSAVRSPNILIGLFEFSNLGKIFKVKAGNNSFYYKDRDISSAKKDQIVDAVSGAYLMISRKCFKTLSGFDEQIFMYLEDVDLGTRANHLGMKVVYCPHSKILHVGGASSDNKYKIRHQAWFDSRKYYFKKHFNFLVNSFIQPLYSIEEFFLKLITKL